MAVQTAVPIGPAFAWQFAGRQDWIGALARGSILTGDYRGLMDWFLEEDTEMFRFEIGQYYWIETLTKIWVGQVVSAEGCVVTLENAAWIAVTSRFKEFTEGTLNSSAEVEPAQGEIEINTAGILSKGVWFGERKFVQR